MLAITYYALKGWALLAGRILDVVGQQKAGTVVPVTAQEPVSIHVALVEARETQEFVVAGTANMAVKREEQ